MSEPEGRLIKFIYSGKATTFSEISIVDLFYVVTVKSTAEISQNVVVFSEYMNFKPVIGILLRHFDKGTKNE